MSRSKPRHRSQPGEDADLATVRDKAVALLARREHSRLELKRKLQQREYPREFIEQALDELIAEGLLSEARYAEALVHSRINRGFGPLRILAEAAEAGADEALIQQALASADIEWQALAVEAHAKRFTKPAKTAAERIKQARFLSGRGFSSEIVRSVVGDIYE